MSFYRTLLPRGFWHPGREASRFTGSAQPIGKVARDRKSGRFSSSAAVPDGNSGNGENVGTGAAAAAGATVARKSIRPRPLDMHKPLPVLRADLAEGAVAGEGDGVVFAAPPLRKRDIPTPIIATVSRYEEEQTGSFSVPDGYIRFPRRTAGEDDVAACQYSLEVEDEEWLNRQDGKINEDDLDEIMGILERATRTADC